MNYFAAFLLSTIGGHLIVAALVFMMRRTVIPQSPIPGGVRPREQMFYHLWVGVTERAITTTLFIWAPTQVALFIGGWTALKLAAAWTRRINDESYTLAHVLALVGSALSFSVAIGAGMLAKPESLAVINAIK